MAAGRLIVALALAVTAGILLVGNVRCSGGPKPLARPAPVAGGELDAGVSEDPAEILEVSPADAGDEPEATNATSATDGRDATDAVPRADAAIAAPLPADEAGDDPAGERVPVTIGGRTFRLELAADTPSRTRGLMGRESIAADGGMLFVFPDVAMRSFWMKNCLTDMDIMFLDGSGRVTAMHEMTVEAPRRPDEPEWQYEWRLKGYSSLRPAQFAIEVAPGTLAEVPVARGDRIDLDLEGLKRRAR